MSMMTYYKILRHDLNHYGYQYHHGLNVDPIKFNPQNTCSPGGLYYTTKEYLWRYLHIGPYVARVEIPEDALVHAEYNKWKANKLIIKEIFEWNTWNDVEFQVHVLVHLPKLLDNWNNPSTILAALKTDGMFLQY